MTMTATARALEGGLRNEVLVNGRHTIVTDEPVRLGGTDQGPAPHELLPAMLAACVSTMITTYADARGIDVSGTRVEVTYDNESTPRQVQTLVHAPHGLPAEQLERLQRIADTCPVKRALEAGFSFTDRVVADAPSTAEMLC